MALDKQIIWKAPFKRDDAFPLDRSLVFSSYDDMVSYAGSSVDSPHAKGVPYAGQIVSVVDDTNKTAKIYCIEEVGESIKIKSMESQYTDGNGIDINDENQITVKVADSNITGVENFIKTDANGISVTGVTSNKTLTSEAITIEGGPLATDNVKKVFEGGVIPVGTDIQALLKALFCEEKYPQITSITKEYKANINTLSVTANIEKGELVEVGTTITMNRVPAKSVYFTDNEISVKGFIHGYSDNISGDIISSSAITINWNPQPRTNNEDKYILTPSIVSGFTGELPASVSANTYSDCTLETCVLTVGLGENIYKVTETAPTFVGSHTGITSKYIVSNLSGRSENHKSTAISASSTNREQKPQDKSATFTVTGVYPIFTNGKEVGISSENKANGNKISEPTTPLVDEDARLSLKNTGYTFAIAYASQDKAPYKIYLPSDWEIKEAYIPDSLNQDKLTRPCIQNFIKNNTKEEINGINYSLYQWSGAQGADYVKFTI